MNPEIPIPSCLHSDVKTCYLHNCPAHMICLKCRRPICEGCGNCLLKHTTSSIKSFVETWSHHLSDPRKILALQRQVNRRLPSITEKLKETKELVKHLRDTLRCQNGTQSLSNGSKESLKSSGSSSKLRESSSSSKRRDGTGDSPKIQKPIVCSSTHSGSLLSADTTEVSACGTREKLSKASSKLAKIKSDHAAASIFSAEGLKNWEHRAVRLAASILLESSIIACPYEASVCTSVIDFCGFVGANTIEPIKKLLAHNDISPGSGVTMSSFHRYPVAATSGVGVLASVSKEGIFGWSSWETKRAHFVDLLAERKREFSVEDGTSFAFFDGSVAFLTNGFCVRESLVAPILEGAPLALERYCEELVVSPLCDVSCVDATRRILFASPLGGCYCYDVDTKESKYIDVTESVECMVGLTGIDTRCSAVFSVWNGRSLAVVGKNIDEIRYLRMPCLFPSAEPSTAPPTLLAMVIPSASHPEIIDDGILIPSSRTMLSDGVALDPPFHIAFFASIVRVFRDIFLAFDSKHQEWGFVRITVP